MNNFEYEDKNNIAVTELSCVVSVGRHSCKYNCRVKWMGFYCLVKLSTEIARKILLKIRVFILMFYGNMSV